MSTIATKKNKSKKSKKTRSQLADRPIPYVPSALMRWSQDDVKQLGRAIAGCESRFHTFFSEALLGLEDDLDTLTIALSHETDQGELGSKVAWRLSKRVGVLRELFERATNGKAA